MHLWLVKRYAKAWEELDASIIIPFLADDFHYGSMWVMAPDIEKEEYINYIKGKFNTIKNTNSKPLVEVARNSQGMWDVKLTQNNNVTFLHVSTENGLIKSAYMMAF